MFRALLITLLFSSGASATPFDAFYYKIPILICHDQNYLACSNEVSEASCTRALVQHRASCRQGESITNQPELQAAMMCMIMKHTESESINDFEQKCEGGLNINLTEAGKRVANADPQWIEKLLK